MRGNSPREHNPSGKGCGLVDEDEGNKSHGGARSAGGIASSARY